MPVRSLLCLLALNVLLASSLAWGECVAIRLGDGRFLRASGQGSVWAERYFPAKEETFELIPHGENQLALKASTGRFLVAPDVARFLRALSTASEPGPAETFTLVPVEGNRVALKLPAMDGFVRYVPGPPAPPATKPTDAETAEIYRVMTIPDALRSTISSVVSTLAIDEMKDKEYDKTRTHKKEQTATLPAPTLRNLKRRKERRIWSMTEEYRVKARLDGQPTIDLSQMAYLDGYQQRGNGRLMLVVDATLPAAGQVHYRLSNLLSATTNFRVTIHLNAVCEVGAKKSNATPFGSPQLVALHVQISSLDISNDVLNLGREPIEDLINHELRESEGRIREKANSAICKALEKHPVRLPLLHYLGFPL